MITVPNQILSLLVDQKQIQISDISPIMKHFMSQVSQFNFDVDLGTYLFDQFFEFYKDSLDKEEFINFCQEMMIRCNSFLENKKFT